MKRKILLCFIAYVLGILIFDKFMTPIPEGMAFVIVIAAIIGFAARIDKRRLAALMAAFFCLGIIISSVNLSFKATLGKYVEKDVSVKARITEVLNSNDFYDSYRISLYEINENKDNAKTLCELSVKKYNQKKEYVKYNYGDIINLTGKLDECDRALNFGDIDYRGNKKADGVYYTITANSDDCELIGSKISLLNIVDLAHITRDYFIGAIDKHFSGNDASLLKGMLLSVKDFEKEYYNRLSDSGMTHITVASGLHTGCIFAFICALCLALKIKRKYTYAICTVFLFAFAFLQGCTPSIIRASVMLGFYMLAQLTSRDYDKENILCITAFIMLLINPYMLFDMSFILSFSAVLGIILFNDIIYEGVASLIPNKVISSIISVSVSVQAILIPVLAMFFGKVNIYSVLANVLIVPILTVVLAVGFAFLALSGVAPLAAFIGFILKIFVKYINLVINIVSMLPFSRIDIFRMNIFIMVFYYIFILILRAIALGKAKLWQLAAFAGTIAAAVAMVICISNSYMRVDFINVEQADAALIKIPFGRCVVIDGGGSPPMSERDFGEIIFVPYLKRNGINTIDYAVVSHYDKDHAQGIYAALRLMNVKNLVLPYRESGYETEYKTLIEQTAKEKGVNILYLKEGDSFEAGEAKFMILAPEKEIAENNDKSENDRSLVVKAEYKGTSFLFTGDIGSKIEDEIAENGKKIHTDVLKVSHHGSKKSSSKKFIETSSPFYAIISVGKNNSYNHPSSETLNTLYQNNVIVYQTDECGTIRFYVGRKGIFNIDTLYERDEEKSYLKGVGAWLKTPQPEG